MHQRGGMHQFHGYGQIQPARGFATQQAGGEQGQQGAKTLAPVFADMVNDAGQLRRAAAQDSGNGLLDLIKVNGYQGFQILGG